MDTDQDVQQITVGGTMAAMQSAALVQGREFADIATLHRQIRTQNISPVEVVKACLKRIEQLHPKLNAFITVLADQALEQARAAEAEIKAAQCRARLHGIPVGVKDFYDTAGIKTTSGFEIFQDPVSGK